MRNKKGRGGYIGKNFGEFWGETYRPESSHPPLFSRPYPLKIDGVGSIRPNRVAIAIPCHNQ